MTEHFSQQQRSEINEQRVAFPSNSGELTPDLGLHLSVRLYSMVVMLVDVPVIPEPPVYGSKWGRRV